MKIISISTTPLYLRYRRPFHWAHGAIMAAEVILVEVKTDEGVTGFGECIGSPSAVAVQALLREASSLCMGCSPFDILSLTREIYQRLFAARGTGSAPRFAAQIIAGIEMALWDVVGKAVKRPAHELLGGSLRDTIQYFGFPQGATSAELEEDARQCVARGCEVIYIKVGRGEELDIENVERVRAAIGHSRLRLDANEAWDTLTAARMIRKLAMFDVEFIEQPTNSSRLSALTQVKKSSPIGIAADQCAFTPEDVYEVCRRQAADLIVLGLHETGGLARFCKAAAVAEAAGLNVCIHGLYESGITTCATNQAAAVIANLDDGNQYMNNFLHEDIVEKPDLALRSGRLPIFHGDGLGFELNWDAVARAAEAHRSAHSQ